MVLYTLKEYVEGNAVVCYFTDQSDGGRKSISFDFYSDEDISLDDFFNNMEEQLSESGKRYGFPKEKENSAVIILFCEEGGRDGETADEIAFTYKREENRLELAISFDSGKCNSDMAGEILRSYAGYLSSIE